MGRFDAAHGGRIHLVETVADVAKIAVRDPARLAVVTQTTLSVDDTADVIDSAARAVPDARDAAQGRHLLRDAEPPGRGEEAGRAVRRDGGGRIADELEFQSPARDRDEARHAGLPRGRRRRPKREWFEGKQAVGVTAGASAPELLVQHVVARLRSGAGARRSRSWGGRSMSSSRCRRRSARSQSRRMPAGRTATSSVARCLHRASPSPSAARSRRSTAFGTTDRLHH